METSKKPTNGQLTKKIKNALVFVEKDKTYQSAFFEDKMLRIETTEDYCIVSTGFHQHVFKAINPNQSTGYARPYLYTKQILEYVEDFIKTAKPQKVTFSGLLDYLNQKEDKTPFNVSTYYSWWLFNIFQPLYQIGENAIETFVTYESFLHNIARSTIILSEKEQDITNKQFVEMLQKKENQYLEGIEENVLFAKNDENDKKKEIEALNEIQDNEILSDIGDGSKN